MKHRTCNILRNQKGFTLIELIIAVAISGLIIGSLATAIMQIFIGHTQSSGEMTALRQVQNVGYWINRDGPMAEDIDATDNTETPSNEVLTIYWTQITSWTTIENEVGVEITVVYCIKHKVTYVLTDDRQLIRYDYVDTESLEKPYASGFETTFPIEKSVTPVAQYITEWVYNSGFNSVTVTAFPGGFNSPTETRTYEIDPRPNDIYWM